jgi:hypothetical protein
MCLVLIVTYVNGANNSLKIWCLAAQQPLELPGTTYSRLQSTTFGASNFEAPF